MSAQYDQDITEPGLGWLFFAGTVLGIAGIMRLFDALWAFRYDGAVPDELEGAVLGTSLSTYGWLWLAVGLILIGCSFAVLNRSQFARWIGIIAGAVPGHLSAVVDAVLPGVVTRLRLHRCARHLRTRCPRWPRSRLTGPTSWMTHDAAGPAARLDLYWIPLGAGARVVCISGKTYETLVALVQRRPRRDLYHSALIASVGADNTVIEMAPIPDIRGWHRARGRRRGRCRHTLGASIPHLPLRDPSLA